MPLLVYYIISLYLVYEHNQIYLNIDWHVCVKMIDMFAQHNSYVY